MNSAVRSVSRLVQGRLSIIRAAVSSLLQLAIVLIAIFLSSPPASGQVATGFPPFSSQTPSTFDTIDNANLNVHFSIPIVNKAGRGMPFSYSLSYDNSAWMPSYGYWYPTWYLVNEWGWRGTAEASTGYVTYYTTQGSCYIYPQGTVYYNIYNFGTYNDPSGTIHPIYAQVAQSNSCSGSPPGSQFFPATDGSGLWFSVTSIPYAQVITPSGITITPPLNQASPTSGTSSLSDANGNTISASYTSTAATFTDTLALTALTVTGSGTPSSPTVYTYTGGPSDGSYEVTAKYTNFNIQTNFGCSGIVEYSQSNVPLITEIDMPDGTEYTFTYESTLGYSGDVTARIASVTLPTGGEITYSYGAINCTDGSASLLTRTVYPTSTTPQVWTYAHNENGSSWTTDITAPADEQGNQPYTVMDFQGIYEAERTVYSKSGGTLLDTVDTCFNGATIPCTGTAITLPISSRTVQVTLPSLSPSQAVTTYNAIGLPTETDEYTYGPTLVRKTLTTYDYNPVNNQYSCGVNASAHVQNRPCTVQVEDSGSNVKALTTNAYDGNGDLLSQTYTNTGGSPSSISDSFTYTSGVMQTSKDFNLNQTTYSNFTCNNAFPTTITPPISSLKYTLTWDCYGGVPLSIKDPNGNTTTFKYDYLWRPTETDYPDTGKTTITYTDTQGGPFTISNSKELSSGVSHETTQKLDGLARVIQFQDNSASTYVVTTYDNLGRVYTVSNPYSTTNDPTYGLTTYLYDALNRTTSVAAPDGSTTSTSYTTANCPLITDPQSKKRTLCSDALGRITSVTEDPSGLDYTTSYTYDVLNDLTGVSQSSQTRTYTYDMLSRLTGVQTPEVNVSGTQCSTTYGYDANGNVTSRVAPAANQNTSCSTHVTTTYAYDAINRLTSKSYNDGQTPTAAFFYDQAPSSWPAWSGVSFSNALGKLVLACTNSAAGTCTSPQTALAYSYDKVGRTQNFWQCNPSNCSNTAWNTQYNYDLAGDVNSWSHPGGFTLTNTVNSAQQVTAVQSSWVDSYHPQSLVYSMSYSPWGAVNDLVDGCAGSGCATIQEAYTYNKLLQPGMIELGSIGTPSAYYCLAYNYGNNPTSCPISSLTTSNDNGNVMGYYYVDGVTPSFSHPATYAYDGVNRLSSAAATGSTSTYNLTFGYDAYGNMTCEITKNYQGLCPTWAYNPSTNQLSTPGFAYDAAGNLTADASNPTTHYYKWDAEGRVSKVDPSNNPPTWTFTYDAMGNRVQWAGPGGTDLHMFDPAGTWLGNYGSYSLVDLGYRHMVTYTSSNTLFNHVNNLGSTSVVTNYHGAAAEDTLFYPWGQLWQTAGSGTYYFASLPYRDTNTTTDLTTFRNSSPNLGRWLSPDLMGGDITDPQSLNRYAYVANNPTTNIDPLGLWCIHPMYNGSCSGGGGDWGLGTGPFGSSGTSIDSGDSGWGDGSGDASILSSLGPGDGGGIWGGGDGPLSGDYGPLGYPSGGGWAPPCDFGTCGWSPPSGFAGVPQIDGIVFTQTSPTTWTFVSIYPFGQTVTGFYKAGYTVTVPDFLNRNHPGQLDMRDADLFCSGHIDIDKPSPGSASTQATGQLHLDTVNPWGSNAGLALFGFAPALGHLALDQWELYPGSDACM